MLGSYLCLPVSRFESLGTHQTSPAPGAGGSGGWGQWDAGKVLTKDLMSHGLTRVAVALTTHHPRTSQLYRRPLM